MQKPDPMGGGESQDQTLMDHATPTGRRRGPAKPAVPPVELEPRRSPSKKNPEGSPRCQYWDMRVLPMWQCPNPARDGFRVCPMHGVGHAKREREGLRKNVATAAITHGNRSIAARGFVRRWLDGVMAEGFDHTMANPGYGSLQTRIALSEGRLAELLSQLPALREELSLAAAANDADALEKALAKQARLYTQISENQEERRKLTETEGKNLERLQRTLTQDQARLFVAQIVKIVTEEVKDPATLAMIARRMQGELTSAA